MDKFTSNSNEIQDEKKFQPITVIKAFYPLKLGKKIYLSIFLFAEKGIMNFAASCSFYFLLSIIPLILIFLTVLDSYLAGYGKIADYFFRFLSGINPAVNQNFFEQLGLLKTGGGKIAFGVIGGVSLIWSSRSVFSGMRGAFDIIFDDGKKSNVIINNLVPFIFVPIIFAASVIFFIAATFINKIKNLMDKFGWTELTGVIFSDNFSFIITILFIFAVTFCFYRFLPARRPAAINAFTGAVLFTVSFLLIQTVFRKIIHVADYYLVYGVISVLIAGLFWVYILFIMFYIFAQFVYVQHKFTELELIYYYINYAKKEGNFIEKWLFPSPTEALQTYASIYKNGEKIIEENGDGGYFFILVSGNASVERGGHVIELMQGEIFGARGVIAPFKYSSTVTAETDCITLKLPQSFYEDIVALEPKFLKYMLEAAVR